MHTPLNRTAFEMHGDVAVGLAAVGERALAEAIIERLIAEGLTLPYAIPGGHPLAGLLRKIVMAGFWEQATILAP